MKVKFRFGTQEVEIDGYSQLNLLAHAQMAEQDLQSRCGGQCECATCRVVVISGTLSPMGEQERGLLGSLEVLGQGVRLACQCFPASEDVVVEVPRQKFTDARGRRFRL